MILTRILSAGFCLLVAGGPGAAVPIAAAEEPTIPARTASAGATELPARTSAEAEAPAGARLVLEERSHDFGDVPRKGGDLVHEFLFRNDGDAPLVLTRVFTSCSCLKTSFSKRPVAPGAEGMIRVTYEPHKSEPGAFNKVIQVYSNSTGGRALLTVQGNSIDGGAE